MAFGSSVLTHKKEQQIKIAGEFKPTVDCLCAIRRGFVAVYASYSYLGNKNYSYFDNKPMCGIVGFTGNRQAAPILLDGLSKLEYRGYDSAGLAVRDGENLAQVVKAKGRLSNLIEKTDGGKALKGTCGIGHTRWATHGEPSQTNAHPHVSGNCTRSGSGTVESEVVGVHNGIIENYTELKEKLLKHLGITNANKGKSRAITHSFGTKLKALMLGEEVEITFCDVQGTKKTYKFTEVERMSFVLFGILYASRCNNFHGNVAARMNSMVFLLQRRQNTLA